MRCRRLQRFLLAFLDDELTQKQHQKVAVHLTACPSCAAALQSMEQTLSLVRTMDIHEPEEARWEAFLPALQQRLRQEEAASSQHRSMRQWFWYTFPRPTLVAFATALLLVSALPFVHDLWKTHATPIVVLSEGEDANLLTAVDFLKNLDLLEEVDVVEDTDTAL